MRVRLVARYARGGRLLDVGCAKGGFLAAARDAGFVVRGVEPAEAAAAVARRLGLDVVVGTLDDVPLAASSLEVVTAWHVLEHIPEPLDTLIRLRRELVPGGHLLIEVPNAESVKAGRRGARGHIGTGPPRRAVRPAALAASSSARASASCTSRPCRASPLRARRAVRPTVIAESRRPRPAAACPAAASAPLQARLLRLAARASATEPNHSRRRRPARRGLTSATKERYATAAAAPPRPTPPAPPRGKQLEHGEPPSERERAGGECADDPADQQPAWACAPTSRATGPWKRRKNQIVASRYAMAVAMTTP